MTFAQQNPQDTAGGGASVMQQSERICAPQHLSVWQWNTGQPSIFGGLQKEAAAAKKSAENQCTRFRQDPVKLAKKPNRNGSGRTIPLKVRIDLDAVYAYRISGKTWDECAAKFQCSTKHIHKKMIDMCPELRKVSA